MSELERIKLVSLENKPVRQISQMSSNVNKTQVKQQHKSKCSCLSCIRFRRNSKHENEIQEEMECLNTHKETPFNASPQVGKLHAVQTETFMTDVELNEMKSKCIHGFIKIQDSNSIILNQDGNKYLKFKYDSSDPTKFSEQITVVPKFMRKIWSMKSPHIIIPIITGVTNFKNWKNQKLEEQFRRGLMKVEFF